MWEASAQHVDSELLNYFLSTMAAIFALIVLQMHCYCKCFVALPHGALGRSAVCDCGIS